MLMDLNISDAQYGVLGSVFVTGLIVGSLVFASLAQVGRG